ncbi:MAG: hypothetical protein HUU60_05535 [Armatimonadetes bacterium]|nr:hypothetical protein [Armatimonadota bacterium]
MASCRVGPVESLDRRIHPLSDSAVRSIFAHAATPSTLTPSQFLAYFKRFGVPNLASKARRMTEQAARANADPRYLVVWFLEGGWLSYDMFSPVNTPNHVLNRLSNVSEERYRVLKWDQDDFYRIKTHGPIRYGYLAEDGKELFKDMSIVASMSTGTFHSGERLKSHMGEYRLELSKEREPDERSINQAFAEAVGQSCLLPNIAWHWWLSDGELNEAQYTGRRGFYHALGPVWAHTIYGGTPANLRRFLSRMREEAASPAFRAVQNFLDESHRAVLKDDHVATVKSYVAALDAYKSLSNMGGRLDGAQIANLFRDDALRERFKIAPEDELMTYSSVNGNKARTKYAPMTNVQAMMAYELMRENLSCTFWIESRDIRLFDSHRNRGHLWNKEGKPQGQTDQTQMMRRHLWDPLKSFVELLKNTPAKGTNKSLWDCTTILVTSEFGRSIHGDVKDIVKMNLPEEQKQQMINDQDICQHWPVTSCFFMGGTVAGNKQFGGAGEKTLNPIPLLPDGSMDPAFDPLTGELKEGAKANPRSFVPNHGHAYSTALSLSGIDPKGKGRNRAPALGFIARTGL